MHKWYEIKAAKAKDDGPKIAEIYVYGDIGNKWDDSGVIAATMVKEIAGLDVDEIKLRINSYGGSVPDGLAIFNALKRHKASVHTFVDGVAVSCASYIAMAGDKITMAKNAQMMVHAPWGYAIGNAMQMREQADVLDRYAKALASGYADKSGMTPEDALALLTDGKDHWYLAEEAVAAGLADEVGDEAEVAASIASSFNLSRFLQPPAGAGKTQEHDMPDSVKPAAATADPKTTVTATATATATVPFSRSTEDNQRVLAMFKPFLAQAGMQELQTEVLADTSLTVEVIQAKLLKKVGEGAEPVNPKGHAPRIQTVEDETDKIRGAAVNALMVRAGQDPKGEIRAKMAGNPFRGHRLMDLARACLARAGVKTDGMSQMEVVAAAFTQGTSDFPVILENTMHKTLQQAYALANLTWNRFCATGSVSDFRAHNRYRVGSFGNLDAVNELGEFTNKTIPDGEKGSITASTKGNIINLSRQAIINDDLGAFVGLAGMLGRAAARTVEDDVYALLATGGGVGPTMSDGFALFSTQHNNITTSAAITMAALDLDRVALASQKDVSGNDFLDLRPAVLLVPLSLGGTARSINEAQYDPDTANKLQKPNIVNGLFRDIVDTPRMTGTRRYIFADPQEAPVLEVAFLDGQSEPYMEMQDGFDVDGARWKVRLDYGVAAVDYRGAVTNAGG